MGMDIAVVLGVDLGKNVCSVVGLDASGAVVMRRKVRREALIRLSETLPPCIVGMEACCGAHHLGRLFAAHGHDVRLPCRRSWPPSRDPSRPEPPQSDKSRRLRLTSFERRASARSASAE